VDDLIPSDAPPSPYALTRQDPESDEVKVLFDPTPRQREAMFNRVRYLFVYGNRGGGKSVCLRWMAHAMAMRFPGFRYAILRTSFPELMKNHLIFLTDEMKDLGGEDHGFRYNKSEHICYYPNGSMGFYMQAETEDQVKNALGAEVYLVIFDEAPTFQWEHMMKIAASVRIPSKLRAMGVIPLIRYAGNPLGESIEELLSFCVEKDVDREEYRDYDPSEWGAIKLQLEDNPHLDRQEYTKQFAGLPPHIRKAWLDGEPTVEGAIFDVHMRKDGKPWHEIRELPTLSDGTSILQAPWVRFYGVYDHGYSPDPAYFAWIAVLGKRVIVFKEQVWFKTVASDIAKDIVRRTKELKLPSRLVTVYADPTIDLRTGADVETIKEKMEAKGLAITCSYNDREVVADAWHSFLGEVVDGLPRIQMLQAGAGAGPGLGCPYLIKVLPRMKFSTTRPRAVADHKHDHPVIGTGYFLMSHVPTTAPPPVTTKRRYLKRPSTRYVLGKHNVSTIRQTTV
jgi:hypothetical protein